ncbi:hypothetical protein GCM10022402_37680 [Salinactinospora qingdaonensis]|uniref:Uncharacterized protein n=1 Tax=Salinactinospora qingdaonensis TaxID=702744 RepID=A0ABP7G4J7_9ACTN
MLMQPAARPRDEPLQGTDSVTGGPAVPQLVDENVSGHHPPGSQGQSGKERDSAATTKR